MHSPDSIESRACISGYIVLSGIWWGLGAFALWLTIARPSSDSAPVVAVCWTIGLLWIAWLRGFRLRIWDGVFEYRDGFYRTYSCKLDDIKSTRTQWISWRFLWRALKVPRMIVDLTDPNAAPILINTKPFSRTSIASFRDLIDRKEK